MRRINFGDNKLLLLSFLEKAIYSLHNVMSWELILMGGLDYLKWIFIFLLKTIHFVGPLIV